MCVCVSRKPQELLFIPGAGSVKLGHLKTVVLIPQTRVSEVGSPWRIWMCAQVYNLEKIVTLETVDM